MRENRERMRRESGGEGGEGRGGEEGEGRSISRNPTKTEGRPHHRRQLGFVHQKTILHRIRPGGELAMMDFFVR